MNRIWIFLSVLLPLASLTELLSDPPRISATHAAQPLIISVVNFGHDKREHSERAEQRKATEHSTAPPMSQSIAAETGAATETAVSPSTVRKRLWASTLLGIGVLGTVAVLFCYLKLENATRGLYSRRLQLICLLSEIMLLFALAYVWMMIHSKF